MGKKYKGFIDLSQEECLNCYSRILENANEHFEIAELLANNGYYGSAISHLVLCSEELLKAIIIFFDGHGTEIRKIKGMETFFIHHVPRHVFWATFIRFSSKNIYKNLAEFLVKYKFIDESSIPVSELDHLLFRYSKIVNEEHPAEIKKLKADEIEKLKAKLHELLKPSLEPYYLENLRPMVFFIAQAEKWKQQGFYVDYENIITYPTMVLNLDSYKDVYKSVLLIKNIAESYIIELQSMPEIKRKEFINKIISEEWFYKDFEFSIEESDRYRMRKKKPQ